MTDTAPLSQRVRDAIEAGTNALLARARPGAWPTSTSASVPATAAAVMALHCADQDRSADVISRAGEWLLNARNPDGGWGTLRGWSSDYVATATATAALRLTARTSSADAVRQGQQWMAQRDGVASVVDRRFAALLGLVLSLAGLEDPNRLPRIPVEWLLLPPALRNLLLSHRAPSFLAAAFMQARQRRHSVADRVAHRVVRPVAAGLLRRFHRQDGGLGCYAGDPWLTALVCIGLTRDKAAPDLVEAAVDYLRTTVGPDGCWYLLHGLRPDPAALTGLAYAAEGLLQAGYAEDRRVVVARRWLAGCQQEQAPSVYGSPAGGWSRTGAQGPPDALDTALVLRVLGTAPDANAAEAYLRQGASWLRAQQDRRGSWSTFVRNSRVSSDGPCPYVTALAIEALHKAGASAEDPALVRALRWLSRYQAVDGSFDARWYRGGVAGTAAVVRALCELRLGTHPIVARAREWLLVAQLSDGSFSSGRSDPVGTAEDTGHAVSALAGCGEETAARNGAQWLVAAHDSAGWWESSGTCVYLPEYLLYQDDLMTQGVALGGLAVYRDVMLSTPQT